MEPVLLSQVKWPEDLFMARLTREHCLAKIVELEQKTEHCEDAEALADYLVILEGWRWLAERADQCPE
jgi:hypothetical protein